MDNDTSVDITPDKSLVKKLGMVGYKTEQAIAELIDNSIDARIKGVKEEISIDLDFRRKRITVSDDGQGMDIEQLADAMTIAKESKGDKSLGRFGIGMKSACSALGKRFLVSTSGVDSDAEYHAEYDEEEWLSDERRGWSNFDITTKPLAGQQWHGTRIVISEINVPLYPNQVSSFRDHFGIRYGPYLQDNQVAIRVNTKYCKPTEFDVVAGSRIPVDIRLEFGHRITGHIELLKKHSVQGHYGVNLFKNGRLIKAFEKFGFPQHPNNSKVLGRLDLDHVPVNFAKNSFIEESPEYAQAIKKFECSDALRRALHMSREVDEIIVPIKAVFDYFSGKGQPQLLAKRVSAGLSKQMLESSKPFKIMIGTKPVTVSIQSLRGGPLYQVEKTDNQSPIVINRDSKAFEFVKNPLFLIAVIASEARLLTENPDLAGMIQSRNTAVASFLDEWSQKKEPIPRDRDVPIPNITGYRLDDNLIGLHEFLKDKYEFKFQFTSLSTLAPYLHNLPGKVIYTLHTTPGNGRYLAELISDEFDDDLTAVDRPSRDQIAALLDVRTVRRIMAVREYNTTLGSTVAGPEKAMVDLMTDLRTHNVVLAISEAAHILEHMRRRNILDMKKLTGYAKTTRKTTMLNELLEMIG